MRDLGRATAGKGLLCESPKRGIIRHVRLVLVIVACLGLLGQLGLSNHVTSQHSRSLPIKELPSSHNVGGNGQARHVMMNMHGTMDVISIGSIHRPKYQQTQLQTWGSYGAIRSFFCFDETTDSEASCHTQLTMDQVHQISRYCKKQTPDLKKKHEHLSRMRSQYARFQWLQKKADPAGWMCAQKRLPEGLGRVLATYQQQLLGHNNHRNAPVLPDYLFVADDDSYFHMGEVATFLPQAYPADQAHVVAGCMVRERIMEINFTFPFGGWGTIFSRAAVGHFIQPLHCSEQRNQSVPNTTGVFMEKACQRLAENHIGEQQYFLDGMSVADLMTAYVKGYQYIEIDRWKGVGYCLHSDWVVGYFVNFYNIAIHSGYRLEIEHDRLMGYNDSMMYTGRQTPQVKAQYRECNHDSNAKCTKKSHICHYVTPDHMLSLHQLS